MRLKPVVLSVEDDPILQKTIESVLRRLGVDIKVSSNSEDFFKLAVKMKPDLFLVDLSLGEESGFDVILRIRRELGSSQSVIALSGAKDLASIKKSLICGANDFITKPLDRRLFIAKLSKYITTQEIEDQKSDLQIVSSGGRALGRLTFKGNVTEIDELGVKMQSGTLIPNGTVLKLSAEFLLEFGIPSRECLITVTASSFDSTSQLYGIYAEFDGVELQFLERVRHWLLCQSG